MLKTKGSKETVTINTGETPETYYLSEFDKKCINFCKMCKEKTS